VHHVTNSLKKVSFV